MLNDILEYDKFSVTLNRLDFTLTPNLVTELDNFTLVFNIFDDMLQRLRQVKPTPPDIFSNVETSLSNYIMIFYFEFELYICIEKKRKRSCIACITTNAVSVILSNVDSTWLHCSDMVCLFIHTDAVSDHIDHMWTALDFAVRTWFIYLYIPIQFPLILTICGQHGRLHLELG